MTTYEKTFAKYRDTPRKTYHVTPVCLVPNGRAHLGHVAGPILKADIINRALKTMGHESHMISCTDPDELHVVIKAMSQGRDPHELARGYHREIVQDFAALDISFDAYLDPRSPEWVDTYEKISRDLIDEMLGNGAARIEPETMPMVASVGANRVDALYVPREGDLLVGGWISGKCGTCDNRLVGFFCESCGDHYNHEDTESKKPVYFDAVAEDVEVWSVFLYASPEEVLAHLRDMNFRSDFARIVTNYVSRTGGKIRLTLPADYGLSYEHGELSGHHVAFTYSTALFGCHILAGEAYRRITGSDRNPLAASSSIINVLTFGIDNTIPFAFGTVALGLSSSYWKPLDFLLPNHFYNLEGDKFSTSRGHVIWGGDIASIEGLSTDLLRLYLAATAPEDAPGNFDISAFISKYNRDSERVRKIIRVISGTASTEHPDEEELSLFASRMEDLYDLGGFELRSCAALIDDVIERLSRDLARKPSPALVKLSAIILSPILPRLAGWLWSAVGQTGTIRITDISEPAYAEASPAAPEYWDLSIEKLAPCLPKEMDRRVPA